MNFGCPGRLRGLPKSRFPPLFSSCLCAWVFKAILSRFWVDSGSILILAPFWVAFWSISSWILNRFSVDSFAALELISGRFVVARASLNVLYAKKALIRATEEEFNEWMKK